MLRNSGFRVPDHAVRYGQYGEVPVDGHAYTGLSETSTQAQSLQFLKTMM